MIRLSNVSKAYALSKNEKHIALYNVSLTLPKNGIVFICGKSGSGKTTLLNILGGIDKPTRGSVIINDKSFSTFSDKDFSNYRNNMVGFIFQEFHLLENLNVEQNIMLSLQLQNGKKDTKALTDILKTVGLEGYENHNINELSVGEMQRVTIARALIKRPHIILADEPTGNLDTAMAKDIFNTLKTLSRDCLVVVVTHDIENAKIYGDTIIGLSNGQIVHNSQIINESTNALYFAETESPKELPLEQEPESKLSADVANITEPESKEATNLPSTKKQALITKKLLTALPLYITAKMGAGNLKKRPIKTISVILASVLTLFAIVAAQLHISFSPAVANARAIQDNDINVFSLTQVFDKDLSRYLIPIDTEAVANLENKYPDLFMPLYGTDSGVGHPYYAYDFRRASVLTTSQKLIDFGFEFVGDYFELSEGSVYLPLEAIEEMYNTNTEIKSEDGVKQLTKSEYPPEKLVGEYVRQEDLDEFFFVAGVVRTSGILQGKNEFESKYYTDYFSRIMFVHSFKGNAPYELLISKYSIKNLKSFLIEAEQMGLNIRTPYMKEIGLSADYASWRNIFISASIVLSLVMILFIVNLVSFGIINRLEEIGVLKALGASNRDIYSIFLAECLILSIIIFVLSIIMAFSGTLFLNYAYHITDFSLLTVFQDVGTIVLSGQAVLVRFAVDIWTILTIFFFSFLIPFLATLIPLKKLKETLNKYSGL